MAYDIESLGTIEADGRLKYPALSRLEGEAVVRKARGGASMGSIARVMMIADRQSLICLLAKWAIQYAQIPEK